MGRSRTLLLGLVSAVLVVVPATACTSQTPGGRPPEERPPSGVPGDALPAVVTDHVDGDTLRLRAAGEPSYLAPDQGHDDTTVRLLEIDTPETGASGGPVECWAAEATAALADLAPVGASVWVTRDRELRDRYGRMLLYLWTDDGELVNEALVAGGHGRAVLFEPNDAWIDAMRDAEQRARSARAGQWGAC